MKNVQQIQLGKKKSRVLNEETINLDFCEKVIFFFPKKKIKIHDQNYFSRLFLLLLLFSPNSNKCDHFRFESTATTKPNHFH
jgi:hypothetical protein